MPLAMCLAAIFSAGAARRGRQGERGHVALATPVDPGAVEPLEAGEKPEAEPLDRRVRTVAARHHPGRGALVDVEVADPFGDGGHDLDRRRPGADHGDALAGEVVVVVPARGVEHLAGEAVDARDLGQLGLREPAGAGDQDVGEHGAGRGGDRPGPGLVVPGRLLHRGTEPEPVERAGLTGDALQVGLDLRLRGEGPGPVRVGREREAVELAGYVARRAGVGVVAPGAPDVVAPVDHQEVGQTGLLQLDRGAEAGEPGADHEHRDVVEGAGWARGLSAS